MYTEEKKIEEIVKILIFIDKSLATLYAKQILKKLKEMDETKE